MLSISELVKATKGTLINGNSNIIPKNYVIDSRIMQKDDFFVPIIGENVDGHEYIIETVKKGAIGFFINSNYKKINEIVSESKKINKDICIIKVNDSKEALYEAGVYNRNKHIDIPVIAITGSVGKTSTREMVASVIKTEKNVLVTEKNYNSIIGAPIMALKIDNQDVCVFELGTDHVGEMDRLSYLVKPNVAVITMIGVAHIGIFGNKENIFKEKIQITNYMKKNGTLIINGDDEFLKNIKNLKDIEIIRFYDKEAKNIQNEIQRLKYDTNINGINSTVVINALGEHNIKNSLCAIKVGEKFKISTKNIILGIEKYKNFSRRLEKIVIKDNITLIDDTYNSSINSVKSGLETINKIDAARKIAVIGDMLDLGDESKKLHEEIGETFKHIKFDKLYLYGKECKNTKRIAEQFIETKYYEKKEQLIKDLKADILPNDVIYLKASNGMKFNEIIDRLKE